ncbi:diamine N-acetyltransferase [Stackebrandtia albiflava]|uniref:Diamine N-acetyltransferase n=1 Tax=Stackebrandtia albiflava TaxID=406432 RepID=A0A562V2A4_9ACTN|nr:GNAT family N-acetyltransferase [Stackebrandtia albiflava]TWJ11952.1 diamine N-acetyltransferase [Stackebrandtia albiflava]
MSPTLELRVITRDNIADAFGVHVTPAQEAFVAPVTQSLAEAYVNPETAWPRLVYADGVPAGFLMAGFDPDSPVRAFRCGIWRLNVSPGHQKKGVGRFAVEAVAAEARRRGEKTLTVLWARGEGGPEEFYLRMGFRPTGEVVADQHLGELEL